MFGACARKRGPVRLHSRERLIAPGTKRLFRMVEKIQRYSKRLLIRVSRTNK